MEQNRQARLERLAQGLCPVHGEPVYVAGGDMRLGCVWQCTEPGCKIHGFAAKGVLSLSKNSRYVLEQNERGTAWVLSIQQATK